MMLCRSVCETHTGFFPFHCILVSCFSFALENINHIYRIINDNGKSYNLSVFKHVTVLQCSAAMYV